MNEQPLPRIQRQASVSTEHRTVKLAEQNLRENYHQKQKRKIEEKTVEDFRIGIFLMPQNSLL